MRDTQLSKFLFVFFSILPKPRFVAWHAANNIDVFGYNNGSSKSIVRFSVF